MLRDQPFRGGHHAPAGVSASEHVADVLPGHPGGIGDVLLGDAAPLGSALNPM
jgi:hypothetical protein